MLHKIEQQFYQEQIRDFADGVRGCLADALLRCIGGDAEAFLTHMLRATKGDGEPLNSWRLNPHCLWDGAPPAFRQKYSGAAQMLKGDAGPKKAQDLPLAQMIHDRLQGLDAGQRRAFLQTALHNYTDHSALYNLERAAGRPRELCDRARHARNVMSLLHRQRHIRYAPERAGLRSSHSSLVDIATRNPGQTICLLTMDWDFCETLAKKDLPNVIPLLVGAGAGCSVRRALRPLVRRNSMGAQAAREATCQAAARPGGDGPACICETGECLPWKQAEEGATLVTGRGEEIRLGTRLAAGGEGEILATQDGGLVAKLYNEKHLTANRRDKLALMLEQPPMPAGVCWPTALLYHPDDHNFAGFLMPRAGGEYQELIISVLQLGKPSVRRQLEGWDRLALVRLCLQLCRLLQTLHRAGILLGDINPRNILARTTTPQQPALMVADCDSCQIGGYPCPVGTRLHTSPAIYRRLNTDNPRYGSFLRTEQDEDYATAVLLFELLMLNQSPFSSKGVTDMGQAVREGRFAYRFTPKGHTEAVTDGSDTPDGPYRMIWGNMPYGIRESFYNAFALGEPPALSHWVSALQCYERDLCNGTYTRELTPDRYYDVDGTRTRDFTCEECGAQSNMPIQRWENNRRYRRMNLCNNCYSAMQRLLKDPELVPVHCTYCGKEFPGNKWQATLESRGVAWKGAPATACARTAARP